MKFTNVLNLPQFFVRACELSNPDREYDDNTFSVTELLNPPYLAKLNRLHVNEKVDDVANRIWAMRGSALHKVIEDADPVKRMFNNFARLFKKILHKEDEVKDEISVTVFITDFLISVRDGIKEFISQFGFQKPEFEFEKALEYTVELTGIGKVLVKGVIDTFHNPNGILYDLKETKAWSHAFSKNGKKEWHEQTNVYAWLLRKEGIIINKIEILCLFRDWNRIQALKEASKGYPQSDTHVYDIPIWEDYKVEEFLHNRIRLHKDSQVQEIPYCNPEERWRKKETYACTKMNANKSSKNCDSESEAREWIGKQKNPGEFYIDFRPGEDTRCLQYCDVNKFCSYYQEVYGKQ